MWGLVKEYCANSTIHGLQFITEEGRHWLERVFWLAACALSWYGAWQLVEASYLAARNSPISFVVDTAHARWDTAFPAITVCEMDNMDRVYDVADRLYTPDHDFNLDEILKEVAYFRGAASFTSEFCFGDSAMECPTDSLQNYTAMIRTPCRELFHTCSWGEEMFDCCERFLPLHTEFGLCFSVNSLHTQDTTDTEDRMISNIYTGLGSLKFELNAPVEVHWHSRADVPYFNKLSWESLVAPRGTLKRRSLAIRETANEPAVRDISPRQRRCRYAEEQDDQGVSLALYKKYSYSVCVVECRQRAALRLCNCTTHMMPPLHGDLSTICDLQGLSCLNTNFDKLTVLRGKWSTEGEVRCECLPECTEPEINLVISEDVRMESPLSKVEVLLERLPGERFQRVVVRSNLDLVVSMGGTAGLFVGASLLSAAEVVYFLVRLCVALKSRLQAAIMGRWKLRKRRTSVAAVLAQSRELRQAKKGRKFVAWAATRQR